MNRRRLVAGCAATAGCTWIGLGVRAARAATPPESSVDDEPATQFLSLFPLGVVAFPGELVLLHIFEPRYKQLISESAEQGRSFGIVTIVSGGASSVGTEMKLDRILGTDGSGNVDVATRGLRVFRLRSFQREVEGKLYSAGRVTFQKNDPTVDPEIQAALIQLYNRMLYRAGARKAMAAPFPENLSFVIGHDVGLSRTQELRLLAMPDERDRQTYLFQHLLRTQ